MASGTAAWQASAQTVEPSVAGSLDPAAAFAAYGHALASLAGWALLVLVVIVLTVVNRPRERTPSGHAVRDYTDRGYRASRALGNALEVSGPFVAATVAAILVGAPPFWVNLLASVFLAARVAMVAVHVGTENQPARSAAWAVGLVCVIGLAIMALVGAFAA